MSPLDDFLLARFDEDRATALAAHDSQSPRGPFPVQTPDGSGWLQAWTDDAEGIGQAGWELLDRWSPARVLADIEAKRRIVELHAANGATCSTCGDGHDDYGDLYQPFPCDTLKALALPYAAHPRLPRGVATVSEQTVTLAGFLLERYDEDAKAACAAMAEDPPPWVEAGEVEMGMYGVSTAATDEDWGRTKRRPLFAADGGYAAAGSSRATAAYVAYWNPARVLADIEAHRKIVEKAQRWIDADSSRPHQRSLALAGWDVLTLLAQPYRDHPGFRPEWTA